MVGDWNNTVTDRFFPNRCSMRAIIWKPNSECPPRSKKLSWTPTRRMPRSALQIRARPSSVEVRGSTKPGLYWPRSSSLAGSAFRSALPLGVRGSCSKNTNAAGTIYSGNFFLRSSRKALASGLGGLATRYATKRFSPGMSSRTIATASRTAGCWHSTASIS